MNIHDLKPIRDALAEKAAADATSRARARLMNSSDPQWYLAHTGPADSRAVDRLTKGGIEVYYPQMRVQHVVPRDRLSLKERNSVFIRKEWVLKPLFKRYLLLQFDIRGGDWRSIFEYAGVHGLISNDDGHALPAPVSGKVLAEFRKVESDGAFFGQTSARKLAIAVGDAVKILEGPFMGHPGAVTVTDIPETSIEELDENIKIKIAVMLFGRVTPVELPLSAIAKVSESS
jgi:transcription antitermination factor NusG